MKRILLLYVLILLTFSVNAEGEDNFINEIVNAKTKLEKEKHFLNWVNSLSQTNNLSCDSLIINHKRYIDQFSEEGSFYLLIYGFNNARIGGLNNPESRFANFSMKAPDVLLTSGMIKFLEKSLITDEEYTTLKNNIDHFSDPIRKSLFYTISTAKTNITKRSKIDFLEKALEQAKLGPTQTLASSIYDIISNLYLENEQFELALLNQQKGVSLSRENNLTANTAFHLVRIGEIHLKLGNLNKAKSSFKEAEQLVKNTQLDYILGTLYNYLGVIYELEFKYKKSISNYQKSLIKFYNVQNEDGLARTHKNIGKVFCTKNYFELADENYDLSNEFYLTIGDSSGYADLNYYRSILYLKQDKLEKAENALISAIEYWTSRKKKIPLKKAYLQYAKIKSEQGLVKASNDYLLKYISVSDSIHKAETEHKLAELSELYQSEQKERKIIEQEKELEQQQADRNKVENELTISRLKTNLMIVIFIFAIGLFIIIYITIKNKNKREQLVNAQKETELQQKLLRSQMNPHFIFNAMTVIQSYIYDEDTSNSTKFLVHFSKLMRLMLENNTKEFISLEKEMEIINRYLVIQKMRFEERFEFVIENETIKDLSNISIPPMLIQPFIENAIEHGNLDQIEDGMIKIRCEIKGDLFIFTIEDNGIGRKASSQRKTKNSENHQSMAIKLTRERIALLNKKHKRKGELRIVDLNKAEETGTKVFISTAYKTNYINEL
ncbi:tetratricopeptide repeat-containing sensor histidine kinase [Brumimicrobium aurantiacum]|uniref:Signal transduction histidine kinase internal region domain-containing protein n=1 Tax=Brumimicrobium aurantiacum TaxID=1737063 RepID=A0A3E1EXB3_9FLAO|nr:histidine kinase [Brumimicrobium aurantiacum]RFC54204.1 hypothetical protein DXU93_09465 [Brumimicrobium aurantiacum]